MSKAHQRWVAIVAIFLTSFYLLHLIYFHFRYGSVPPLPMINENAYWPMIRMEEAVCRPKIYIYDIPKHIQVSDLVQNDICKISNYNADVILHNLLKDPTSVFHKLYVTDNPEEAEMFFIPFLGACYLYKCWKDTDWQYAERCDVDNRYVGPLLDYVQNDLPYWNKSGGRDHIMIHPMDNTYTYYSDYDRFEPSIFLTTIGDKRAGAMWRHRNYRDIVIPSATRALNYLHQDPSQLLNEAGQPRSGKRDIFALFRGCCDTLTETDVYSHGIRGLLFKYFAHYPNYNIGHSTNDHDYAKMLSRAKYGLTPQGYTLDTTRLWEYIAYGVVPVIMADGIVEPFESDIDWDAFTVRIRRDEVHLLDHILRNIDEDTYERKRQYLWKYGRRVGLEYDAWHFIVRDLCRHRQIYRPENLRLGY